MNKKSLVLAAIPLLFSIGILLFVEWNVQMPMLLLERSLPGWGWVEIIVLGSYASFLFIKLHEPIQSVFMGLSRM